jgi:hypothetical protein
VGFEPPGRCYHSVGQTRGLPKKVTRGKSQSDCNVCVLPHRILLTRQCDMWFHKRRALIGCVRVNCSRTLFHGGSEMCAVNDKLSLRLHRTDTELLCRTVRSKDNSRKRVFVFGTVISGHQHVSKLCRTLLYVRKLCVLKLQQFSL